MKSSLIRLSAVVLVATGAAHFISSCTSAAKNNYVAIDTSTLDKSFKPTDDFYEYVNHKWCAANPVPSTESRYGVFNVLSDSAQATLHKVMQTDASKSGAAKGSSEQMVGDFYFAGMDTAGIDKAGFTPIKSTLDSISAIKTVADLTRNVANMQMGLSSPMFDMYVDADQMNSKMDVLYLSQGGLGLPDRDFYFRPDMQDVRAGYSAMISKMFTLVGDDQKTADAKAKLVVGIEEQLAKASRTVVQLRDPYANYNKMTIADLQKATPNIDWNTIFKIEGTPAMTDLVVGQPEFFTTLNGMMKSVPVESWKAYLQFHCISSASNLISSDFDKADFDFYETMLRGTKAQKPRWKRVLGSANFCIGEMLGQEYVKAKFSEDAKKKATDLIHNLITSLGQRIDGLDWMTDSTKAKAHEKLNAIMIKVGYPDKWKDYTGLVIDRTSYYTNVLNAAMFEKKRLIAKIGKPVDRTEWGMTPQTVNAYYNPTNNEIVFPAAILQAPFFDEHADNAVNYGGIGVVIGHELTHGFDDQGRLYDATGNLNPWWTPSDSAKFVAHTDLMVKHYSSYCPLDSICINGNLTLGENIADNGGILISYYAFQTAQKANPQAETIDGLTANQRFFISFATVWRGNFTDQSMKQQLLTNPHSPGKWRVIGTLSNTPEFYEAFGVKKGDGMWTDEDQRSRIW